MRSNEVNHFIRGSQWLHAEVQTIEGALARPSLSPKKYENLSHKLNNASEKLQELEKVSGVFAKAQTDFLKEKVVELSKTLVDKQVENEISQIQKKSFLLKKRISKGAVKKLQGHIDHLEKNHKPSIPHRQILADAKHALSEAKAKLKGKPVVKHFDWLSSQKDVRMLETFELVPGEIEELFDAAKALYDRDYKLAKSRFNALPEDHKRRIHDHLRNLMAIAFEDPLETIQALIATVNELVENGEAYPTRAQIDQLFLGLAQVTEEENREGKIFSLRSKGA